MSFLINIADVTRTWDVTATPASGNAPPHKPGDRATTGNPDGTGHKHWVFVHNTSGADFAIGVPVTMVNGTFVCAAAAAIDNPKVIAGIPQIVIADDRAGWVLEKGEGTVLDDGATLSAGDLIQASAAGGVEVVVADADCIGVAKANIGAGATGLAYIDCT